MDYIVNSILDAYLEQDPNSRVAIDGVAKNKFITLGGEITSNALISDKDIEDIIKQCLIDIGYEYEPTIILLLYKQSPEIALGTNDEVGGAGDQGTITGYACNSVNYIPLEKHLADSLVRRLFTKTRKENVNIKSDMKTQVTIHYDETGDISIPKVVAAVQHTKDITRSEIKDLVVEEFISICKDINLPISALDNTEYIVNGTGLFIQGGPEADSGEVGRKIVVDSYGVSVPVGGGTYNGKDCTKVDRSAAYMARYVAKNIVAAGLAEECLITVSYCIGLAEPMSIDYDFKGTEHYDSHLITQICNEIFSFKPQDIIKTLKLQRPMFATAGVISHFGLPRKTSLDESYEIVVPWEVTDKAAELQALVVTSLNNSYSFTEEEN